MSQTSYVHDELPFTDLDCRPLLPLVGRANAVGRRIESLCGVYFRLQAPQIRLWSLSAPEHDRERQTVDL
jgi:hypothetical protein